MRNIQPSRTLEFNKYIKEYVKNNSVISLGLGESEINTPVNIVEAGINALKNNKFKYSSAAGINDLRNAIAKKLNSKSINVNADNIIITPGAKNALFISCLSIMEDNDEVILFNPCYVSNRPIIQLSNSNIIIKEYNLNNTDFRINIDKLEKKITEKTKLLFINYPNNPTGNILTKKEADGLYTLMKKNPQLHILSDEIYDDIVLGDEKNISLAAYSDIKERIITVGGFSKSHFMTGWRIGYIACLNKKIVNNMVNINQQINTNTPVFTQCAALAGIESDGKDLKNYLEELKKRKIFYNKMIINNPLFNKSTPYEGGYFSFLNISQSGLCGDEFAVNLLKNKGVAVIPGESFGDCYSDFCRISFVNYTSDFKAGIIKIIDFMEQIINE